MVAITPSTIGAATMAHTAPCPDTQHDHLPGLAYSPEWHRQQDAEEQAWLNAFIADPTIAITLWKATP